MSPKPSSAAGRVAAVPLRQSSLRASNLRTVLQAIYAASVPRSRADVAAATGLTRSTVSRLVDDLIAQGLVEELERVFDGQRGRPAVPLVPRGGTFVGLGLEINVRHAAVRLVDLAGTLWGELFVERDMKGADPEAAIRQVAQLGCDLLDAGPPTARLAGVQLALPGLVDAQEGILLRAPNLGWHDVRPGPLLHEVFGDVIVGVGNEADFAAVPMAWSAPGRPSELSDFLYVSGEVGIGSALVIGGEPRVGRHGWAGEIGHMCVDPEGPICGCGAQGCLETYVGQDALRAASGVESPDELVARLAAGDPTALRVADDAARRLGIVLAGALNLLDVSDVVLGGHLGRIADHLLPGIEAELRTRVMACPFVQPTVTTRASDVELAALGAAYVAVAQVIADPVRFIDREPEGVTS